MLPNATAYAMLKCTRGAVLCSLVGQALPPANSRWFGLAGESACPTATLWFRGQSERRGTGRIECTGILKSRLAKPAGNFVEAERIAVRSSHEHIHAEEQT